MKKEWIPSILKCLCLISIVSACYSIITYGQTVINSDTATATLLARAQVENGQIFPRSWYYGSGTIWTIGANVFTLPFTYLIKSQSLARMVASCVIILLTSVVIFLYSKKILKDDSWVISIPILLIFLWGMSDVILYQVVYSLQMFYMLLGYLLLLLFDSPVISQKKKYVLIATYEIMMIVLYSGGSRWLAEYTLPMWLSYMAWIYLNKSHEEVSIDKKKSWLYVGKYTGILFVPVIIGTIIYKLLFIRCNVYLQTSNILELAHSISDVRNNFWIYLDNLFVAFGYQGGESITSITGIRSMVSVTMTVLIVFVVPILQATKLKDESRSVRLFFYYGVAHNFILAVLGIFFSKNETRYVLSSIFVCIIVSARYIMKYWLSNTARDRLIWISMWSCAVLISCIGMYKTSENWKSSLAEKKAVSEKLLAHDLHKGYATYWNAYSNSIYSDLEVEFYAIKQVKNTIKPQYFLVDRNAYDRVSEKSFIMLSSGEYAQFEGMLGVFGTTIDQFSVNDYQILVYDHDVLCDMKSMVLSGEILQSGELSSPLMVRNEYVKEGADCLTVYPDGIIYGPYAILEEGIYEITIHGSGLENADADIFSASLTYEGWNFINWEIVEQTNDSIKLKLDLNIYADDMEFRIFNKTESEAFVVNYITVEEEGNK